MIACGEMLMSHRSPGKNGPIPTADLSPWTLHKNPNFTARLILTFLRLQSGKSDIFTSKVDALTSYDVPVFIGNHIRRAVSYFFFFLVSGGLHTPNTVAMAGKVVLHYFNGRGKMESIRWLLAVAEVEVRKAFDIESY